MTRLEKIQRLNAIAADYEKGMSLPALAEKYGVCVRTCYRAIDKDAVKERTVALNKATKLDTEILNDYIANMSVTNIAAKNKTSTTHCYRVAKEAGLCSLEQGRNRRSSPPYGTQQGNLCQAESRCLSQRIGKRISVKGPDCLLHS